jgi:hypothetical protein
LCFCLFAGLSSLLFFRFSVLVNTDLFLWPMFCGLEQYRMSATHWELMYRHAVYSFGLFLYQKSEFWQITVVLRVKGHLLQNVGARFVKK